MLTHDPAFGFHQILFSHKKAQKAQNDFINSYVPNSYLLSVSFALLSSSLCALCAFLWQLFFLPFCGYSPNQPCASSSLTPMRRLPSMSSIHEPLTSASS